MNALLVILLLVAAAVPAYAYIDLGTGSYVVQMAAAFLFGFIFAIKLYWKRCLGYVQRLFGRKQDHDPAA
ncbi:MAG TPA: hypothetical protein PKM88_04710 [bacterium]|nr:hypothetical protein [bacterium]